VEPTLEGVTEELVPHQALKASLAAQVSSYLQVSQQLFLANRKLARFAPAPHLMLGAQFYHGDFTGVPLITAQASDPDSKRFLVDSSRVDSQK